MNRKPSLNGFITSTLLSLVCLTFAAPLHADQRTDSRRTDSARVWRDSTRWITHGRFQKAATLSDELSKVGPLGEQVSGWLQDLLEMEQKRQELTEAEREKYIAWAKEQHSKGYIFNAVYCTLRAFDNTPEAQRDEFRKAEWLQEIRKDAMARAAAERAEGEWLDAHSLYYQLSGIWEHDPELRRLKRECLTHARLDVTYKPDGKWREYLAGIDWRMARAAMKKIDLNYVSEPDFKEFTIAGLEQLVLLAESPALQELFPALAGKRDGQAFRDQIEVRITQLQSKDAKDIQASKAQEYFSRALKINRRTVDLPESLVVNEFMSAAMETLDDFSTMIWPVEFREFDKHTRGDFIGVGISIARVNGQITVVTPLEGSPAYRAGIVADDVILAVDGEDIGDLSLTQAVDVITGPIDTEVTLTVRRLVDGADKEIDYTLKRASVVIQSVKGYARNTDDPQTWDYLIDPQMGIAYVRIVQFAENTVPYLYQTIQELRQKHELKGLILDLRFNPGGLLTSAVHMSELFLDRGDRIVSTKGDRRTRTEEWPIDADRSGPFHDLPLVVLINGQSASASEIVAGALQDHDRAIIIGERTFGKFSVQNLIRLGGTDAHLKLTTAAYYLPSGRSLHHTDDATEWGVTPDIDVPLVTKELAKVVYMRREADVLVKPGTERPEQEDSDEASDPAEAAEPAGDSEVTIKDVEEPSKKDEGEGAEETEEDDDHGEEDLPEDPNNRPEIDPQLETALFVMRVELLKSQQPQIALQSGENAGLSTE